MASKVEPQVLGAYLPGIRLLGEMGAMDTWGRLSGEGLDVYQAGGSRAAFSLDFLDAMSWGGRGRRGRRSRWVTMGYFGNWRN